MKSNKQFLNSFKKAFEKEMKGIIEMEAFNDTEIDRDDTQMYCLTLTTRELKLGNEFHSKDLRGNIFIGTNVNPNGIDSTGRIGRTWVINLEIKGQVRRYRCRNWHDDTIAKYYDYAESEHVAIDLFKIWLDREMTRSIRSIIK